MRVRFVGATFRYRSRFKRLGLTWSDGGWCGEVEEVRDVPIGCFLEICDVSERIGSLWQLEDRCKAGEVEAWVDACVAASIVLGPTYWNPEEHWPQALADLEGYRRELMSDRTRGVEDLKRRGVLQEQAIREFYFEVDRAIEEFDSQFQEVA